MPLRAVNFDEFPGRNAYLRHIRHFPLILTMLLTILVCAPAYPASQTATTSADFEVDYAKNYKDQELALAKYEELKQGLAKLGVPSGPRVLNYLALELFYNVPGREVVAKSIADVKVIDMPIMLSKFNIEALTEFFNEEVRADLSDANRLIHFKAIQLSGNGRTFLVWDPQKPSLCFIFKKHPENGISAAAVSVTAMIAIANNRHVLTDIVPEELIDMDKDVLAPVLSKKELAEIVPQSILRPLSSIRGRKNSTKLYPLHGFLGSPLFREKAWHLGMTRYEYFKTYFIPHLAHVVFNSSFRLGINFSDHTQNLWIAFNKKDDFWLVHKDLIDAHVDTLVRHRLDPQARDRLKKHGAESYFDAMTTYSPKVNKTQTSIDNPRSFEPGYQFATLTLQTILGSLPMTRAEKGEVLNIFFEEMLRRLWRMHRIPNPFSQSTKENLEFARQGRHVYDFKISLRTNEGLFGETIGLTAVAEQAYREIYEAVNKHLIGERIQHSSPIEQRNLSLLFAESSSTVCYLKPIRPVGLSLLQKTKAEIARGWMTKLLINPWYEAGCSLVEFYRNQNIHFETSKSHILKVDSRDGKIWAAVAKPRNFALIDLSQDIPICEAVLRARLE